VQATGLLDLDLAVDQVLGGWPLSRSAVSLSVASIWGWPLGLPSEWAMSSGHGAVVPALVVLPTAGGHVRRPTG
jgi:hypothetical protein